jgi:CRP-like cAMP-binding protein
VVEGEAASTMYFVVSGLAKSVRVETTDGVRKRATLGAGEVIAADAVLAGRSHDASVFAHTPMRLLALSSQDLMVLLRKYPRLRRRLGKTAARAERKFHPRRSKSNPEPIPASGEE